MRLEAAEGEDTYKVWMTDDDLDQLRRATVSYRDDVMLQLGGFVGLRAFEIPQVKPTHVQQTDADHYRLRVPRGKDTTSSGGKPRNAYIPKDVERSLRQYQNAENIAPDQPFVDLSVRGVRAAIKRTAESAAEEIGDSDRNQFRSYKPLKPYIDKAEPLVGKLYDLSDEEVAFLQEYHTQYERHGPENYSLDQHLVDSDDDSDDS